MQASGLLRGWFGRAKPARKAGMTSSATPPPPRTLPCMRLFCLPQPRLLGFAKGAGGGGGWGGQGGEGGGARGGDDGDNDGGGDGGSRKSPTLVLGPRILALQLLMAPPHAAADEVSNTVDRIWDWIGPVATQLGFSGLVGLVTAAALKYIGKRVAIALGVTFALLQALQYLGFIEINWMKVQAKLGKRLDITGDEKFDEKDIKKGMELALHALSKGVPSVAGFCAGFLLGLRIM